MAIFQEDFALNFNTKALKVSTFFPLLVKGSHLNIICAKKKEKTLWIKIQLFAVLVHSEASESFAQVQKLTLTTSLFPEKTC